MYDKLRIKEIRPELPIHYRVMQMSDIEFPIELPPIKPSLEEVLKSICNAMGVQQHEVKSKTRKREITAARQSYMSISRILFLGDGTTIEDIARLVNKDHSTVIHACKLFYQGYEKDKLVVSSLSNIVEKCMDAHVVDVAKKILKGDFKHCYMVKKHKKLA